MYTHTQKSIENKKITFLENVKNVHQLFFRLLNKITGQFFLVIFYCDESAVF